MEKQMKNVPSKETKGFQKKLGQIMLDYGFLSANQLEIGLKKKQAEDKFIGEILVESGIIDREVYLGALSLQLGIPSFDLRNFMPDEKIIKIIPEEVARSFTAIPVGQTGAKLTTAMRVPQDEDAIKALEKLTRKMILPCIGWASDIETRLDQVYSYRTGIKRNFQTDPILSQKDTQMDPYATYTKHELPQIHARLYLGALKNAIDLIPIDIVQKIIAVLIEAYREERCIYIMGNGGSAATASHFACDLGKGSCAGLEKRFRVISLADSIPFITAWSNDTVYENIFIEQLKGLMKPEDIVIGISGSGNSANVLNAIKYANSLGAFTIALTGFSGGKIKNLAKLCLIVPSFKIEQVEDTHLAIEHLISTYMRKILPFEDATFSEA